MLPFSGKFKTNNKEMTASIYSETGTSLKFQLNNIITFLVTVR
jgi:hypothetical protein